MIAPIEPDVRAHDPQVSWRIALVRLSRGLIAYGMVGLVVAVLGMGSLFHVGGQVATLGSRVGSEVDGLIATIEETSTVLDDAGSSALSFAVTLERTPPTIRQAAITVTNLQSNLRTVEAQLGSISVLGSQPLAGVAGLFGQMASDLSGLDTRLGLIADDMGDNRDALLNNATSLKALGVRLGSIADDLRDGSAQDRLADLQILLTLLAFVLVALAGLPAVGALAMGFWLQRELRRSRRGAVPEAGRWDGPDGAPGE